MAGHSPYTVVMRRDHPAAHLDRFSISEWLSYPHLVVSGHGDPRGSIDGIFDAGKGRRVAAVSPSLLHALELLQQSNLISTLPDLVLMATAASNLTSLPAPIKVKPVTLFLIRHRRSDHDPAVALVAEMIKASFGKAVGGERAPL